MDPFSLLTDLFNLVTGFDDDEEVEDARRRAAARRRHRVILVAWYLHRKRLSFKAKLNLEGRRRRDRRIPRSALLHPSQSAWMNLHESGSDQALITVTGFDHEAFANLVALFEPWFESHSPWVGHKDGSRYRSLDPDKSTGRKRLIDAKTCLGLVLAWYRFRGGGFILQGWFGLTGNHASVWIRFGRRGLFLVLKDHEHARVEIPDDDTIEALKHAVTARHDLLTDVYCVADGLKLHFEQHSDLDEQSMYYNGWHHCHYVTNLIVFSIDGRIISGVLNAPGSLHDSTLAEWGGVYERLEEVFNRTGGVCCVDSAFASANAPYLIRSSENATACANALDLVRQEQATSLRQAAEWGMRAIQGAFPRLKETIKIEENGERSVILNLMPLLYNYRLATVGLNQLRNVYVPSWSVDADFIIQM
jgi:DDE superfamily endonuclease